MVEKHWMNLDRVMNSVREHHNSISNDLSFGAKKITLVIADCDLPIRADDDGGTCISSWCMYAVCV